MQFPFTLMAERGAWLLSWCSEDLSGAAPPAMNALLKTCYVAQARFMDFLTLISALGGMAVVVVFR